jgi:transposase
MHVQALNAELQDPEPAMARETQFAHQKAQGSALPMGSPMFWQQLLHRRHIQFRGLPPFFPFSRAASARCHNRAELFQRPRSVGYGGSLRVGAEWRTRRRRAEAAEIQLPIAPTSARSIARLMTVGRHQISHSDAMMVTVIEKGAPQLVAARDLFDMFKNMVRFKASEFMEDWIEDAESSLLGTFARSMVADRRAIAAAATELWSNGQTEGQTKKLKIIKRQMYGRANLDCFEHAFVCCS